MDIKIPVPEQIDITELRVDDSNPNIMSEDSFQSLKKGMEKFGFIVPVILNKDGVICDGFHRYKAARELGMNKVLAIRLDVSEVDRRIIRQVLNKLRGEHDSKKDLQEYETIMEAGGFDLFKDLLPQAEDYESLLESNQVGSDDQEDMTDEQIESSWEAPKYKVDYGDVWQLGQHRLMCGDSTINKEVDKLMSGNQADCHFIDPPYNLAFTGTTKGQFGKMENDAVNNEEYDQFIVKVMKQMSSHSKPSASVYICIDYRNYYKWVLGLDKTPWELINCIVWDKVFAGIGYKYRFRHEFIIFAGTRDKISWYGDTIQEDFFKLIRTKDQENSKVVDRKGFSMALTDGTYLRVKVEDDLAQRVPLEEGNEVVFRTQPATNTDVFEGFSMNYFSQREAEHSDGIVHPTMKPTRIITRILKNSTKKGDLVLDLCAGSGSTLIAAEQMGRAAYCMEIEPKYCSVIIERWEQITGQRATKAK